MTGFYGAGDKKMVMDAEQNRAVQEKKEQELRQQLKQEGERNSQQEVNQRNLRDTNDRIAWVLYQKRGI